MTSKVMETLGFDSNIFILLFTGSDIKEGTLPEELTNKNFFPNLLFLSLDAMYNLYTYVRIEMENWIDVFDKIVIDEVHTTLSEICFREKYKIYSQLPALGIPINAVSESIPSFLMPKFAKRIGLSCRDDVTDMTIFHGSVVLKMALTLR